MIKSLLSSVLLVVFFSVGYSQQTIVGTVFSPNGKSLSSAHVLDINSRNATVTDALGKFQLTIADSGTDFRISHVGFRPVLKPISASSYYYSSNAIQNLTITLEQQSTLLSMVQVRPKENTILNGKRGIVLHDFSFSDGNILLMAEDGIRYLVLCDADWRKITRVKVGKRGSRLYDDCLGNVHLFGDDSVYQIVVQGNQLKLDFASEQSYFLSELSDCSTSNDSHIFFSSYDKAGQEVYHYGLHRQTKKGIILQRVFDHVGLQDIQDYFVNLPQERMFNSRFERAGSSFENERLMGLREVSCCVNGNPPVTNNGISMVCVDPIAINQYRNGVRNSLTQRNNPSNQSFDGSSGQYFQSVSNRRLEQQNMMNTWNPSPRDRGWINLLSQPTYSPMFSLRDSIFVFDHVLGVGYVHDNEGNQIRRFPIEHQEHKGWRNLLVSDKNGKKLYAHVKQQNKIYLIEIDLNDGSLLKSVQLNHALYGNHLKVKDGYAYYLKEFRDIYQSDEMLRQKL